jgi:Uma2 family endonuclease
MAGIRTVLLGEPPPPLAAWLERRRALGQDLYDEVWEGEYHVAPAAHRRHGDVEAQLAVLLHDRARTRGLWPTGPVNIGEPDDYRVPDRAFFYERVPLVFLPSAAIVVEVVSPADESYAKLGFYFGAGVEEVLIADPEHRHVEWYQRGPSGFVGAGRSSLLDLGDEELATEIDWPD